MLRRDRLIRKMIRERFLVTLHSGDTFEGLLLDADPNTFVLADAWAVSPKGNAGVDGRLYLPRREVAYLQTTGDLVPAIGVGR